MTAFNTYAIGTVSVANGDTALVFSGAILSSVNARAGDTIHIDGASPGIEIGDVTDTTHVALVVPWSGGAKVAAPYIIVQNSPQRFAATTVAQDVNTLVAALNKPGFIWFVGPTETEPDPSRGDEGQWANQPSTGKQWHKEGGLWVFDGVFKAFGIPAPYDAGHEYSVFDVATSGGSSYVWINATPGTGHAPPNATYWAVLSAKGDQGIQGVTGASYAATSTTSLAIGTGSKAFTTQAGLAYTNGARVRATSAANSANWMEGPATYSGTTLTIAVDKINGSGTLADWNFNIAGQPGAGDLSSANNLSDLASASTARTNLGLGTAAVRADTDFPRTDASQSLTAAQKEQAAKNMGLLAVFANYLSGLGLTYASSTTITIASGCANDSTNTTMIALTSAMTKGAGSWAAGTGNGAFDGITGTAGWYHWFVIKNPTTGAVDVLMSGSATAPTLPTGYTLFRRIGASNYTGTFRQFIQDGDLFQWNAASADVSAANPGTSAVTRTLLVPYGVRVEAHMSVSFLLAATASADNPAAVFLSDLAISDQAPSVTSVMTFETYWASTLGQAGSTARVMTNTSSQIRSRLTQSSANTTLYINTSGWIDRRGRD